MQRWGWLPLTLLTGMAGVLFWQTVRTPLTVLAPGPTTPEAAAGIASAPAPPPTPPGPLSVVIIDHTPTPEPTISPRQLAATSTAQANDEATAYAEPGVCPTTGSTGLCVWPTTIPTPWPTATAFPICSTPVAGETCRREEP